MRVSKFGAIKAVLRPQRTVRKAAMGAVEGARSAAKEQAVSTARQKVSELHGGGATPAVEQPAASAGWDVAEAPAASGWGAAPEVTNMGGWESSPNTVPQTSSWNPSIESSQAWTQTASLPPAAAVEQAGWGAPATQR